MKTVRYAFPAICILPGWDVVIIQTKLSNDV